jgi:hypothetical protein
MAVLCFLGLQDAVARVQSRREQQARFAVARNAIARMDEAFQQAIANKPVNEQFFRQNELLIEYQKLALTLAYMPPLAVPDTGNKTSPRSQGPQQPQAPPPHRHTPQPPPSTPGGRQ